MLYMNLHYIWLYIIYIYIIINEPVKLQQYQENPQHSREHDLVV